MGVGAEVGLCVMINWTEKEKRRETLEKTPGSQLGRVGIELVRSTICRFGKGKCLHRLQLVPSPAGCLQVYS